MGTSGPNSYAKAVLAMQFIEQLPITTKSLNGFQSHQFAGAFQAFHTEIVFTDQSPDRADVKRYENPQSQYSGSNRLSSPQAKQYPTNDQDFFLDKS